MVPDRMSSGESYRRRLAAVWFADVVEYTRLTAQDEDGALRLVRIFHDVASETVERYGGRVVKRIGDAVMAEFGSTQEAVSAALSLLGDFGAEAETRDLPRCELRIGIHLGEVTTAPDGDLYGDGVNVAARVHSAAAPGQVVVSDDVARHLRHRREFLLEPLGSRELKGLAEPVAVYAARYAEAQPVAPAPPPAAARFTSPPSSARVPAVSSHSIAVLPFANLSPDPENEYFSDGVTEEIRAFGTGTAAHRKTSGWRARGSTKRSRPTPLSRRRTPASRSRRSSRRYGMSMALPRPSTGGGMPPGARWRSTRGSRRGMPLWLRSTSSTTTGRAPTVSSGSRSSETRELPMCANSTPSIWRRWVASTRLSRRSRAPRSDPLSLVAITGEGDICLLARRYEDAIRLFRRALELDPTFGAARYPLAMTYHVTGRHEEALAEWQRLGLLTPEDVQIARAGLEGGQAAYLEGMIKMAPAKGAPPSWIGAGCARVGRYDEAFEWLERAVETHDFLLVSLAVSPLYDPIRDDPRYRALIERLGLDRVALPSAASSRDTAMRDEGSAG